MVGMGERTTPQAVEILAHALFASGAGRPVIAVELPKSHAFMHLDTVMTMVDPTRSSSTPTVDRDLRVVDADRRRRRGRSA